MFVLSHLVPACQGHTLREPCPTSSPAIPEPISMAANEVLFAHLFNHVVFVTP